MAAIMDIVTTAFLKPINRFYGISLKYGLSVEQLRKKNSLDKNSVIFVGQKLNVK